MRNPLLKGQRHQFLCRRTHAYKPLSHRNHGKPIILKILRDLSGSPSVIGNLPDVEPISKRFNKLLDITVMNHVSFRQLDVSLFFPEIIRNVVPFYSEINRIFQNPEIWQDCIRAFGFHGRKHQTERGQICCQGKIQSSITYFSFNVARETYLNVWIPYTFPFVCGNCSKPKIGAVTGALRLRELVHMFFYLSYGGQKGAIVSTYSPLLNRFIITVSTQYAVNLPGNCAVSGPFFVLGHRAESHLWPYQEARTQHRNPAAILCGR